MPRLLDDVFEERYAAVIVCDGPPENGSLEAFAYGPEQECPFCEEAGCRAWEFYDGVVYTEHRRPEFEEHAAIRMVGDCQGDHADEPRDATGNLMRP